MSSPTKCTYWPASLFALLLAYLQDFCSGQWKKNRKNTRRNVPARGKRIPLASWWHLTTSPHLCGAEAEAQSGTKQKLLGFGISTRQRVDLGAIVVERQNRSQPLQKGLQPQLLLSGQSHWSLGLWVSLSSGVSGWDKKQVGFHGKSDGSQMTPFVELRFLKNKNSKRIFYFFPFKNICKKHWCQFMEKLAQGLCFFQLHFFLSANVQNGTLEVISCIVCGCDSTSCAPRNFLLRQRSRDLCIFSVG